MIDIRKSAHAEAAQLFRDALPTRWEAVRDEGGGVFSTLVYVGPSGLSTYDSDELTRFVLLCHERCWRGWVTSSGPNRLRLWVAPRVRIEGAPDSEMSRVCPTIEQAIEAEGRWLNYWRAWKDKKHCVAEGVERG